MKKEDVAQVSAPVQLMYFRDASALYGEEGLISATGDSAGMDLRACFDAAEMIVGRGERIMIPTGIAVEPLRPGIAGFVYSRSGLGAVKGLTVAQGVGVIDPDYRGEILVYLLNTSGMEQTIRRADRIAQLVFQPFVIPQLQVVDALGETGRGGGGFGHTGQ